MTRFGSTAQIHSTAGVGDPASLRKARQLADDAQSRWLQNEAVDLAQLFRQNEEFYRHKTVAIELAYAQYCRLRESGASAEAEVFCRGFPTIQKSLLRFIEVQNYIEERPHLQSLFVETPWPEVGTRFLTFDLLAELGQGAFGRVYLAAEPALGRRLVAVKVSPGGVDEANILGKLSHPSIVPVYSVQRDDISGLTAICMPYLGRATLCDVLDRAFSSGSPPASAQPLFDAARTEVDWSPSSAPSRASAWRYGDYVDAVVDLAVQLCDGLSHAHRTGVLHRDLKPSNILIAADGHPLLLDFNLSTHDEENIVRHGGTLPYTPPEMLGTLTEAINGAAAAYDARSDIFSLGVVIYELLTGELPFRVGNWRQPIDRLAAELLNRQKAKPRPAHELNRRVEPAISRLLDTCLAYDVETRPCDAATVAAAFRQHLSVRRRGLRWIKRHRVVASLALSMVAIVAMVFGMAMYLRPPYAARKYRESMQLTGEGRQREAIVCLDEVLLATPNNANAWAARAHLHQLAGDFNRAFDDYSQAQELSPTPRWQACRGFCLSKMKQPKEAVWDYRAAVAGGYCTPAVLNNLGVSCLELNRLDEAEDYFCNALTKEPTLAASQLGMANLALKRARSAKGVSRETLALVTRFARQPGASAELCRQIGLLHAYAAQKDPEQWASAFDCLSHAVEKGIDPQSLCSHPALAPVQSDARLARLREISPSGIQAAPVPLILDPY